MMCQIDSNADHDRMIGAFKQYASKLRPFDEEIVRPFDQHLVNRKVSRDDLLERNSGDQRESRCGRIAGPQSNEGADIEIAFRRVPFAALTPLAASLTLRAQPQAFGCALFCQFRYVVISGTRFSDRPDQNRAPAAFCAARSI